MAIVKTPIVKPPKNGTFKNSKGIVERWVNGKNTGPVNGTFKTKAGKTVTWKNGKPYVEPTYKFGASFFKDIINKRNEIRGTIAGLNAQGRDNELEYMRSLRDTDKAFDDTNLLNLNRAAARGVAFSSPYAKATTDTANQFNQVFGDLASKRKLFLTNDLAQRSLIKTSYNDFLRGLALEQAQNDAINGGALKGVRAMTPRLSNDLMDQKFKTDPSNDFLTKLRKKYGI